MEKYFKDLNELLIATKATDNKNKRLSLYEATEKILKSVAGQKTKGGKVIFIGNGGSASIASHIATDFLKNCGIPAMVFNDASLITCLSNDLGYEYVFQKPIEMLAEKQDILFAISSSGKSKNILNAAQAAKKKGCLLVTLSGFAQDNPLRKMGDINFYIQSRSYGYVEIAHLAVCHYLADKIMEKNG